MVSLFLEIATGTVGIAMSLAHVPQAYRIWKRKSSADISLITYTIFFIGSFVWLLYGISLQSKPIIVSYLVAVLSTSITYVLAIRYHAKKTKKTSEQ